MQDIRGLRVPFLSVGWNRQDGSTGPQITAKEEPYLRQFLMMREFGFVYDSSIAAPVSDPPLWPYTLDYQIPHKCLGQRRCPSRSFPGEGQFLQKSTVSTHLPWRPLNLNVSLQRRFLLPPSLFTQQMKDLYVPENIVGEFLHSSKNFRGICKSIKMTFLGLKTIYIFIIHTKE